MSIQQREIVRVEVGMMILLIPKQNLNLKKKKKKRKHITKKPQTHNSQNLFMKRRDAMEFKVSCTCCPLLPMNFYSKAPSGWVGHTIYITFPTQKSSWTKFCT